MMTQQRRWSVAILGMLMLELPLAPIFAADDDASVIISNADSGSQSPDVAIGPEGSINVVWIGANLAPPNAAQIAARGHSHDSSTDVFFARSVDGGETFDAPRRLNVADGDVWGFAISKPRVAVGPDGIVHVLFPGNVRKPGASESETAAMYVRSSPGALSFEPPRRINIDALSDDLPKDDGGSFGTIIVDRNNTVHAAWVDTRMMAANEYARLFLATSVDGGKSFSRDREILASEVCPCCQLTSVVDANGRLLLGARLVDGQYRDNALVVLDDHGRGPVSKRFISGARWELNGCPRKPTSLAARGKSIVATYYSGAEQPDGVYVVHSSDAGVNWSSPQPMHPGALISDAPVAVFSGPRLYAVWHARTADGAGEFRLFASHSDDNGKTFATPVALPLPAGSAKLPAVAARPDGRLQIVWQHDRTIRSLVWPLE